MYLIFPLLLWHINLIHYVSFCQMYLYIFLYMFFFLSLSGLPEQWHSALWFCLSNFRSLASCGQNSNQSTLNVPGLNLNRPVWLNIVVTDSWQLCCCCVFGWELIFLIDPKPLHLCFLCYFEGKRGLSRGLSLRPASLWVSWLIGMGRNGVIETPHRVLSSVLAAPEDAVFMVVAWCYCLCMQRSFIVLHVPLNAEWDSVVGYMEVCGWNDHIFIFIHNRTLTHRSLLAPVGLFSTIRLGLLPSLYTEMPPILRTNATFFTYNSASD